MEKRSPPHPGVVANQKGGIGSPSTMVANFTHIYIQGSLNKFSGFFRMGTFIDSTHMKF